MTNSSDGPQTDLPSAGRHIGPYRLLEPLGRGGVALVFRAVDEKSGEVVALKTVRAASEGLLASIRREIQALGRIQHPGVVKILDGGVFEGRPWYTMELLEGGTLREHLKTHLHSQLTQTTEVTELPGGGGIADVPADAESGISASRPGLSSTLWLPRARAFGGEAVSFLNVIRRLCEPLAYIHGEGFVHRDLKPSNIFVRKDGSPVLMDFGLVWLLQQEGGREVISVDAARGGTIVYMAPEQARGERMDARGDLFSLGCILYEAITGELAYPARTRRELVAAHERPPIAPSQVADGVSPQLDALVMGLLERNPRDRIGHASDVAGALADLGAQAVPLDDSLRAKDYLYRPEIVGRGALLEAALGQITQLRSGRGGLTLIAGESGIGKTSFASEVARRAGAQDVRVVTSECTALAVAEGRGVRQGGPLYPLARLLQSVADRCVAEGAALTRTLLGERAKILSATEPSLRHLPGIESYPEPSEVPGEAARRRLIDAMAETLSAFAIDRPILVVLDDLQWADDLTLAFLGSLSERYFQSSSVLILGTYRSEESTPDLEQIVGAPHVVNLRLGRLDIPIIGTMAADMLGQRHVSEELAAFLSAESAGNPFFVAEYLRAAVDVGLLFRNERGRWQQVDGSLAPDRLGLPHNLHALVTRRLKSLTEPARRLAEVASVLGREVDVEVVGALAIETGIVTDDAAFDEVLRNLLVKQVLETATGGMVRFVHDKLREIAYEGLAADRQRTLHGAAARLLEKRHTECRTLETAFASLAHHFEKAGDLQEALNYFDKAGEAAHRMHANQEAYRLLESARALEKTVTVATSALARARRERLSGLNALALGNVNEALLRMTEATVAAGRPWPRSRIGLSVHCLLALANEITRRLLPWLGRDRPLEDSERELLLEAARAYERLLVVYYFAKGDMLSVVLAATVNMGLAERAGGVSSERALGYATFGVMCALLPFQRIAQFYCGRALEVARDSRDDVAESWVRMNVAVVHLQAGRWPEMQTELELVRSMARKMGFPRRWEEATSQLSTAHLLNGRIADSVATNDELVAVSERADPQSKCWGIVRRAEVALLKGDIAAAVEAAREGERLCQRGLGFAEWIYTLGPLALAFLRSGDAAAARAAADQCSAWALKGSAPIFYNIWALAAISEVYLALWEASRDRVERDDLARASRRAVKRLRLAGSAMAVAAPQAYLWRGMEALKLDRRPLAALRLFRESAKRANRLGMSYDEGRAFAALGEHALDPVARARELREAMTIFSRIGAAHDLASVKALLENINSADPRVT